LQRSDPVDRDEAPTASKEVPADHPEATDAEEAPLEAPATDAVETIAPPDAEDADGGTDANFETAEPEEHPPDEPASGGVTGSEAPPVDDPTPTSAPAAAPAVLEADEAEDSERAPGWRRGVIVTAPAVVLTVLLSGVFFMFLLIEPSPRWVVLFGSVVAALSMDGVLRAARREAFEAGGLDTTVYLLLPALYALAAPVFLEHNVRGYWALPAAALAGLGFGALVVGQVSSVRAFDLGRPFGRYVAATATYFVAFALFSLMFTFDVHVRPAVVASGLVAALLAAELLRDDEIDQLETLVFSAVTGVVIAEVRLAMHYLPIDGHLAALTLLLAFYFVTGLIHAHVTRQLDRSAALEYVTIAVTGLVLVVGAQAVGIA